MTYSRKNLLMKICDNRKIPYHKEKLSWSWINQQCPWFSRWLTYATKCSCKPPLWSQPSFQASKHPICEILFRLAKYHKKGKWTILTKSCRMRFHTFPCVEQLLEFQICKEIEKKIILFTNKTFHVTQCKFNFTFMTQNALSDTNSKKFFPFWFFSREIIRAAQRASLGRRPRLASGARRDS